MTAGSGFVPVVDDHMANRLAAVPRTRARRTARADGGEQAAGTQGALRDELFDCVPVDMLMPELDGYQVLEHARPSRDAAFMSIPEVRDPPVDQLSALRPLCAPACRPAERRSSKGTGQTAGQRCRRSSLRRPLPKRGSARGRR